MESPRTQATSAVPLKMTMASTARFRALTLLGAPTATATTEPARHTPSPGTETPRGPEPASVYSRVTRGQSEPSGLEEVTTWIPPATPAKAERCNGDLR